MFDQDSRDLYRKDQEAFYTGRFQDFGLIVQADGWTSENMAHYYYDRALQIISRIPKQASILEVGSGHGFFYKYLQEKDLLDKFNYSGIEINENSCKESLKMNPDATYHLGDFLDYQFTEPNFDYTVFMGTFSISESLDSKTLYQMVEANLRKAFMISNYATVLLISRFLLENSEATQLFNTAKQISEFYSLDNTIFGDYIALALYKKKFVLEAYSELGH